MPDRMLRLIESSRSRLNLAIVAHRALAWALPSAAAAGFVSIILALAGAEGAALPAWACILLAGALAGAFRARKSLMGSRDAARWIDERLDDEELFSAALACVERGRSGRFDDAVLEKASGRLEPASALRPPLRPTARKAAFALAAAAASLIAALLARPLDPYGSGEGSSSAAAQAAREPGAASASSEADRASVAAALAASIFPEDKRMATLAERALREGRMDDFRDILKGADIESSSMIDRAVNELEKRKLTRDDPSRDGASGLDELAMGESEGMTSPGGGAQGGDGGPDRRDGPGSEGFGPSPEGGLPGGPDGGQPQGGSGDGESRGGESRGSGSEASTEGAGESFDWGELEARAEGGKLALKEADASSFFELVLPGEGASAPASMMLPSSARAAESAMSREGVPLEYLDFVRSYFTALSKGESE